MESYIKNVKEVEQKLKSSIQQAQQEKQNLERAADERKQAIDDASSRLYQELAEVTISWKKDVDDEKDQNLKMVDKIEDQLQVELTNLHGSCEQAANLIQSDSDSDIISGYPSLAIALQELAKLQPAPVVALSNENNITKSSFYEEHLLDKLNIAIKPVRSAEDDQLLPSIDSPSTSLTRVPSATSLPEVSPAGSVEEIHESTNASPESIPTTLLAEAPSAVSSPEVSSTGSVEETHEPTNSSPESTLSTSFPEVPPEVTLPEVSSAGSAEEIHKSTTSSQGSTHSHSSS